MRHPVSAKVQTQITPKLLGSLLKGGVSASLLPAVVVPTINTLDTPTAILNALLGAEDIAIAYYYAGIQNFANLTTGNTNFDDEVLAFLHAALQEEITHRAYILGLLQSRLIQPYWPAPNTIQPILNLSLTSNEPSTLYFDTSNFSDLGLYLVNTNLGSGPDPDSDYGYGLADIEELLASAYSAASAEFTAWAYNLGLSAQGVTAGTGPANTYLVKAYDFSWAAEWAASVLACEITHSVLADESVLPIYTTNPLDDITVKKPLVSVSPNSFPIEFSYASEFVDWESYYNSPNSDFITPYNVSLVLALGYAYANQPNLAVNLYPGLLNSGLSPNF